MCQNQVIQNEKCVIRKAFWVLPKKGVLSEERNSFRPPEEGPCAEVANRGQKSSKAVFN